MERLTLAQIKYLHKGYFFDKKTMKFFEASNWSTARCLTKYSTRYDRKTGINYVVVCDPWGDLHYHRFNPDNGSLDPVRDDDNPFFKREPVTMEQSNKHECRFITMPEDINDPCKGCRFTGKCPDAINPKGDA